MKTFGYAVAVLLSSSPLFANAAVGGVKGGVLASGNNPSKDDDVSYQLFIFY